MSKKVYERVDTVVDVTTGELSEIRKRIVKKVNSQNFVQVYLEDLSGLFSLSNGVEIKLLAKIWEKCEWNEENTNNGNRIIIVKAIKDEWSSEMGVSVRTIDNTLLSLVKKELIFKKARSIYVMNPKFFFKGFSKDRVNVVKTVLEYQFTDKEPTSNN